MTIKTVKLKSTNHRGIIMARIDILFVLGAGVEKNLVQIGDKEYDGMPLAKNILLEIIKFEEMMKKKKEEKKTIRDILKDKLINQKRLKYVSSYINSSIRELNLENSKKVQNIIDVLKSTDIVEKLIKSKFISNMTKTTKIKIEFSLNNKEELNNNDKLLKNLNCLINLDYNSHDILNDIKDIGETLKELYKDNNIKKDSATKKLIEIMLYFLLLIVLHVKLKNLKLDRELEEIFTKTILSENDLENIFDISASLLSKDILSKTSNIIEEYYKEYYTKKHEEYLAKQLLSSLIDFEELLAKEFINIYTKNQSGIKRYLYLSWIMWAYFKNKELEIMKKLKENNTDGIFYKALAEAIELAKADKDVDVDIKVITFNYTSFVDNSLKSLKKNDRIIHFHGTLNEYIKLKDLTVEKINLIDNSIEKTLENILEKNKNEDKIIIPGFIPPLKLKPVLSKEFLDKWCMASNWIETAENIVVIGYSFSHSDEHFNDLIRKWYKKTKEERHKKLVIIGPSDGEKYAKRIKNLLILNSNKESNLDINVLELDKSNEDTKNLEEKIVIIPNTPAEKLDKNKLKKLFDILTPRQE